MTSAQARATLDLAALHGATCLVVGQNFRSGAAATAFIKGYCFNHNKSCKLKPGGGKCKTYTCPQEACPWEVRVMRRRRMDQPEEYYVSMVNDKHADVCMAMAKPSAKQIERLPAFQAAVRSDKSIQRKAVVALVQARDHTNLEHYRNKVYRAKDAVVDAMDGEWKTSFSLLAPQLIELQMINPATLVALEVDQANRFFRMFLAFGVAVRAQASCLPIVGFDGTHSKHNKYNGVILTLIARDGNGHNLTLATAFVHVENEANIAWFLRRCIEAGIQFEGIAVMCDRGKIQGAVKCVWSSVGVSVQIRFCTIHILRNINKKFGLSGSEFENYVWQVHAAETEHDFKTALDTVRAKFGNDKLETDVADYLAAIEPIRWAVHANMPNSPTIQGSDNDPPMVPCCMFGWRSTNFVESDNNTMLKNGVRNATPYEAINILARSAVEKFSARQLDIKKWRKAELQITPHARDLWRNEREKAGHYLVVRSSEVVWFVLRQGLHTYRRVEVNGSGSLRCSCSTFVQIQIPCRHLMAVLHFVSYTGSVLRAFHSAYMVDTFGILSAALTEPPHSFTLPLSSFDCRLWPDSSNTLIVDGATVLSHRVYLRGDETT